MAQAINEDNKRDNFGDNSDRPLYETGEQFGNAAPPPPPMIGGGGPPSLVRFDVQNSTLQCDAKEFISTSTNKEATPIVSANSNAAEVILAKKDGDSPTKSRKQNHRDPKPETVKEPKETECDTTSSISKSKPCQLSNNTCQTCYFGGYS